MLSRFPDGITPYNEVKFDAGIGNIIVIRVNSFGFEGTSSVTWDPLGIEYFDGEFYQTLTLEKAPTLAKWLYSTTTRDWRTGNVNLSNSLWAADDGWIFPPSDDAAPGTGSFPTGYLGTWHVIHSQKIRFTFHSDTSTNDNGWDIDISPAVVEEEAAIPGAPIPETIGTILYLDKKSTVPYNTVTTTSDTVKMGYITGTNSEDNAIHMRTIPYLFS